MKTLQILLAFGFSLSCFATEYSPITYDSNGFFHLNSGQSIYVGYRPNNWLHFFDDSIQVI